MLFRSLLEQFFHPAPIEMIHDQLAESELILEARKQGRSILENGKRKVLAGLTTVEEILRVTQEG